MQFILCFADEKTREKEKERERLGSASSVNSKASASSGYSTATSSTYNKPPPEPTWIHDLFEGTLTNETRCLCCETVSAFSFEWHQYFFLRRKLWFLFKDIAKVVCKCVR